jgi:hypothetical protein
MDEETRQKVEDAFAALQSDNAGTALDILWRLLGYDKPL